MSQDRPQSPHDRLLELLAERAAFGLTEADTHELHGLLVQFPHTDVEQFERLAAAIDLAHTPEVHELPAELRHRVHADARRYFSGPAESASPAPRPGAGGPASSRRAALGWWAAAACLLLGALGWWRALAPLPGSNPATARAELVTQPGTLQAPLDTTDPKAPASGDIVWSDALQRGYMRLRGLPTNDPKQKQYQLWIFDKKQDARYPIDGGVFDVDRKGEVIVPIRAAIRVADPTMFAITVERPGGVVVSDRQQIVLLGKVPEAGTN